MQVYQCIRQVGMRRHVAVIGRWQSHFYTTNFFFFKMAHWNKKKKISQRHDILKILPILPHPAMAVVFMTVAKHCAKNSPF